MTNILSHSDFASHPLFLLMSLCSGTRFSLTISVSENVYPSCLTGIYHSSLLKPCSLHFILYLTHLFSKGEVDYPETKSKVVTKTGK